MANINVIVKRKQFLWAGGVALALAAAVGVGWYVSQDGESEPTQASEPAPDMTGVVDNTFGERAKTPSRKPRWRRPKSTSSSRRCVRRSTC